MTYCRGYICKSKDEVITAHDKLTKESGSNRVVIKDCFGSSGDDISFDKSEQTIIDNFEWKGLLRTELEYVAIEEDLRYN